MRSHGRVLVGEQNGQISTLESSLWPQDGERIGKRRLEAEVKVQVRGYITAAARAHSLTSSPQKLSLSTYSVPGLVLCASGEITKFSSCAGILGVRNTNSCHALPKLTCSIKRRTDMCCVWEP